MGSNVLEELAEYKYCYQADHFYFICFSNDCLFAYTLQV